MNDKLSNHWPKNEIREDEFLLPFLSLLDNKGYKNAIVGKKINLNRVRMANVVGKRLIEEFIIQVSNEKLFLKV